MKSEAESAEAKQRAVNVKINAACARFMPPSDVNPIKSWALLATEWLVNIIACNSEGKFAISVNKRFTRFNEAGDEFAPTMARLFLRAHNVSISEVML